MKDKPKVLQWKKEERQGNLLPAQQVTSHAGLEQSFPFGFVDSKCLANVST